MLTQYNESLPQTRPSLCCGNIPLLEGNFEDVGLGLGHWSRKLGVDILP